jgi:hypothetical protein
MGKRMRDCFLDGCNTSATCSGCISASATLAYNLSQRYLASSIDVTYARRLMLEDRVSNGRRRAAQVADEEDEVAKAEAAELTATTAMSPSRKAAVMLASMAHLATQHPSPSTFLTRLARCAAVCCPLAM